MKMPVCFLILWCTEERQLFISIKTNHFVCFKAISVKLICIPARYCCQRESSAVYPARNSPRNDEDEFDVTAGTLLSDETVNGRGRLLAQRMAECTIKKPVR